MRCKLREVRLFYPQRSTPEVALCGDSIAARWRRRMPGLLRAASRRDLLRGPLGAGDANACPGKTLTRIRRLRAQPPEEGMCASGRVALP
jgi:hypothetical protein